MLSPPRRTNRRAAPDVTHVLVGFSKGVLTDLDDLLPAGAVLVLDELDVIKARGAFEKARAHPCVAGIMAAPTQDEPHAERLTQLLDRPPRVQAVIPSVEYGVVGAAVLAHAWGLPGAGPAAARTLRDKIAMRAAADASLLAQPQWRIAEAVRDVEEFRDRYGGGCVVKPANRQASLGVRVLGRDDDAVEAWQHCTHADEPMLRARYALPGSYLVEQRLDGPEVSVEALVHSGRVGFTNITAKAVQPGISPVEMGHVVPAGLAPGVEAALAACVQELVRVTGFQYGVLHSEWILVGGLPAALHRVRGPPARRQHRPAHRSGVRRPVHRGLPRRPRRAGPGAAAAETERGGDPLPGGADRDGPRNQGPRARLSPAGSPGGDAFCCARRDRRSRHELMVPARPRDRDGSGRPGSRPASGDGRHR